MMALSNPLSPHRPPCRTTQVVVYKEKLVVGDFSCFRYFKVKPCAGNCCRSTTGRHGGFRKSALLWAERGMARVLVDGELRQVRSDGSTLD